MQKEIVEIHSLKVKSALIPLSFYTVDSRNNKLYFVEQATGTLRTATITTGNYNSSTISAVIKSALDTEGG